jgi:hypothetical protein
MDGSGKLRILFWGSCWPTNIGNAFVNLGAIYSLKKALGEKADIFHFGGMSTYLFNRHNRTENNLDLSRYCDFDYIVMGGMTQCADHMDACIVNLKNFLDHGAKLIIAGGGGEHYNTKERDYIRNLMDQLPIYIFISRDALSYQDYHGHATHSHDGIDSAFFISDTFDPIPLSLSSHVALNFDKIPEPHLRNCGPKEKPDSRPENPQSNSRPGIKSGIKSLFGLSRETQCSDNTITLDLEGRDIIRTHHSCWPPGKQEYFESGNTLISDLYTDYLNIYSQVDAVYSDRVHACIAALSFGTSAQYFIENEPRLSLFERLGIPDIIDRPVRLDPDILRTEKENQIDFLRQSLL